MCPSSGDVRGRGSARFPIRPLFTCQTRTRRTPSACQLCCLRVNSVSGDQSAEVVRVDRPRDGVAVVILNRPHRFNALDGALFDELPRVFHELSRDQTVHVVVLTGAGDGFCAGADLVEGSSLPSDFGGAKAWMQAAQRGPLALYELPQPTIAAVNGPAAGGGLGLALACDIRIAAPTATFSAPFVRMGLTPDFGVSRLLPKAVGRALAMELMLTGRTLDADDAALAGLVLRVSDDVLTASIALAAQIASMPADTVRRIKALVRDAADAAHATVLSALEPAAQATGLSDPRFQERASTWFTNRSKPPREV